VYCEKTTEVVVVMEVVTEVVMEVVTEVVMEVVTEVVMEVVADGVMEDGPEDGVGGRMR
jgi:hypothetical protein